MRVRDVRGVARRSNARHNDPDSRWAETRWLNEPDLVVGTGVFNRVGDQQAVCRARGHCTVSTRRGVHH